MQLNNTILCISLCIIFAHLTKSHSKVLKFQGLEKRGWTLNSAGYLLGPYAQRTVSHGPGMGKREDRKEYLILPTHQPSERSLSDESYFNSLLELFMYLRMKENGMSEDLNSTLFIEQQ